MNNTKLETITNLFQGSEIRSVWDAEKEDYYFSVIDVIRVLTESNDPSHYWRTLKSRMIKEGNETVTNCDTFKLKAKDGKMRNTDMLEHPQGLNENLRVAKRGGNVAKGARDLYEIETKKSAISNKNALSYQYIDEVKQIEDKVGVNNE